MIEKKFVSMGHKRIFKKVKIRAKKILYGCRLKRRRDNCSKFSISPKVLVVMNSGGIGNAVEATPLVQAVRMLWPKSHITVLVPQGDLFDGWIVPDQIIRSEQQLAGLSFDHTFWAYWIFREKPEWFKTFEPGNVICPKVWLDQILLNPERQYYLDMLNGFGFKGELPLLYVSTKKPQFDILSGESRIAIVPGSKAEHRWRHKRWPYYNNLIELILKRYQHVQICIIGTDNDEIPGSLPCDDRIVDLRSRLSLGETAWIMQNSDVAIGNDCGPMHIADSVQTRSIVVFGPSCELKNAYRNKVLPVFSDVPCRPCQYDEGKIMDCDDPQCMLRITQDYVMEKLSDII
jgi:lipopolysaccharide heptosyltransferase III